MVEFKHNDPKVEVSHHHMIFLRTEEMADMPERRLSYRAMVRHIDLGNVLSRDVLGAPLVLAVVDGEGDVAADCVWLEDRQEGRNFFFGAADFALSIVKLDNNLTIIVLLERRIHFFKPDH
jgi:hypothetical protein